MEPGSVFSNAGLYGARVHRHIEDIIARPPITHHPKGPYGGLLTFECPTCHKRHMVSLDVPGLREGLANHTLSFWRSCGATACDEPEVTSAELAARDWYARYA
jgi:hypothetical protein